MSAMHSTYYLRHPVCEVCEKRGKFNRNINVHWIDPKGGEEGPGEKNLLSLLPEHHGQIHAMGAITFARTAPHEIAAKIEAALGIGE
jgi:hypothetical protein